MTIRPTINRVWASEAAGSNIQDPDTFVPNKVTTGWEAEIPPFQWFNWIQNRNDLFKLALAERGVAEWGSDVKYNTHSLVHYGGHIWVSTQVNQNVVPTEGEIWRISSAEITQANLDELKARIEAHIARVNNPHAVTAAQAGSYTIAQAVALINGQASDLTAHETDYSNPHKVTATQAGGVPITGGTYTGQVDIEADNFTIAKGKTPKPVGLTRSGNDVFITDTDHKLGIKADKPVFMVGSTVNELLYASNFKALKDKFEPLYRVPTPDFYMPLTCDTNIYEGGGTSSFSRASTATYVNKAGVITTAAVDEPRFEGEGLIIEGDSTNLNSASENTVASTDTGTVTASTLEGRPAILYTNTAGSWTAIPTGSPTLAVGKTYTISILTNRSIQECAIDAIAGLKGQRVPFTKEVKIKDGLYRRWNTFTATGGTNHQHFYVATVIGGCLITGIQVEELPFVSSYIPTKGSTVTRAADLFFVETSLPAGTRTLILETHTKKAVTTFYDKKSNTTGDEFYTSTSSTGWGSKTALLSIDVSDNPNILVASNKFVSYGDVKAVADLIAPLVSSFSLGTNRSLNPASNIYGHVKNFRIWNEALTPEQISTL